MRQQHDSATDLPVLIVVHGLERAGAQQRLEYDGELEQAEARAEATLDTAAERDSRRRSAGWCPGSGPARNSCGWSYVSALRLTSPMCGTIRVPCRAPCSRRAGSRRRCSAR